MPYYAEKTHILVVDDDDRIRDLLKRYLQRQDFVVSTAQSAIEAADILKHFSNISQTFPSKLTAIPDK